jgi:16S rRNA (uracil1498-N3)-methyltransferase
MPSERFFLDLPHLEEKEEVVLTDQEFHHLANVMRSKVGDQVELVNGRYQLGVATVVFLDKKQAHLHVEAVHEDKPSSHQLILAQAIPRLNRLEFILEKGTELGATAFWLFQATLSERKEAPSESQMKRLKQITISALKQCGRLDLPEIIFFPSLFHWKKMPEGSLFFGDTRPSAPDLKEVIAYSGKQKRIFFIGPESGFHEKEVNFLETQWKAKGVKLHDNILRVDTAALVALALAKASSR